MPLIVQEFMKVRLAPRTCKPDRGSETLAVEDNYRKISALDEGSTRGNAPAFTAGAQAFSNAGVGTPSHRVVVTVQKSSPRY